MNKPRKIAFYAPIKPPDHPIPSGDRLIAGNLMSAFKAAGHEIELASRYIAYSKHSSSEILAERKAGAKSETAKILANYHDLPTAQRPELWITYHPYCKAPDWIGPEVSKALAIPYITIEAARTRQGKNDEWGPWRKEAQAGLLRAHRHLCFKPSDWQYMENLLGSSEKLRKIPAFIDTNINCSDTLFTHPTGWKPQTPVLVTAGMMRKGKKEKNFQIIAETLTGMIDQPWNLMIIGGGPQEAAIKQVFETIPNDRIFWCGQVEHKTVLNRLRSCDVFFWPGFKEPIGMVYLEAQLQGLPVIAYNSMGVPLVVTHGETGLLCRENDIAALRSNLCRLLDDQHLCGRLGKAARQRIAREHSIDAAAASLDEHITELIS